VQAIQKYELLLARSSRNEDARRAMAALKELFSDRGAQQERRRPLTIVDVRIPGLFPSLMLWYASNPAGTVTVKNTLDEPVEDVRVSIRIPRFMDLAVETRLPGRLAPGETGSLGLSPAFDQRVLELQEDLIVSAEIALSYGAGGASGRRREQHPSRSTGTPL